MAQEKIIVDISNGKSTVTVKGVKGASCTELTSQLEEALGTSTGRTITSDYTKTATTSEKERQKKRN